MNLRIKDKIAIVTGGGEGIGRAIALRLAAEGAIVVVADLNKKIAQGVVDGIMDRGGNGMALQTDATKEEDVDRMVTETLEAYEMVDILVNNVGGGGSSTFVTKLSTQVWDQTIERNLKSTFLCSKAVAREMMERKQGRIINIASISGKVGEALIGAYCTAKFGVLGLTQVLAKELGRYSITVNAVCPGYVYTPGWEQLARMLKDNVASMADKGLEEIFEERVRPLTPLGRPQTAEDVASLVAYLASEEAKNITGQAINVDGGAVMS
ncbi:MAG: SDR family NAD(P)-dependent oxidoreductase [Syntrophales bacterium]|nr:SDR family NAD(P)-dependent oxidoreductase [Syntrophales bacterium]